MKLWPLELWTIVVTVSLNGVGAEGVVRAKCLSLTLIWIIITEAGCLTGKRILWAEILPWTLETGTVIVLSAILKCATCIGTSCLMIPIIRGGPLVVVYGR